MIDYAHLELVIPEDDSPSFLTRLRNVAFSRFRAWWRRYW